MLLFLSIISFSLSVILLYFNARSNRSTLYLGFFFLLMCVHKLVRYFLLNSELVFLISVVYVNPRFLSLLIGPAFNDQVTGRFDRIADPVTGITMSGILFHCSWNSIPNKLFQSLFSGSTNRY